MGPTQYTCRKTAGNVDQFLILPPLKPSQLTGVSASLDVAYSSGYSANSTLQKALSMFTEALRV